MESGLRNTCTGPGWGVGLGRSCRATAAKGRAGGTLLVRCAGQHRQRANATQCTMESGGGSGVRLLPWQDHSSISRRQTLPLIWRCLIHLRTFSS
jgi:hypothetical protein